MNDGWLYTLRGPEWIACRGSCRPCACSSLSSNSMDFGRWHLMKYGFYDEGNTISANVTLQITLQQFLTRFEKKCTVLIEEEGRSLGFGMHLAP